MGLQMGERTPDRTSQIQLQRRGAGGLIRGSNLGTFLVRVIITTSVTGTRFRIQTADACLERRKRSAWLKVQTRLDGKEGALRIDWSWIVARSQSCRFRRFEVPEKPKRRVVREGAASFGCCRSARNAEEQWDYINRVTLPLLTGLTSCEDVAGATRG